jgi:hypothetical protein
VLEVVAHPYVDDTVLVMQFLPPIVVYVAPVPTTSKAVPGDDVAVTEAPVVPVPVNVLILIFPPIG